MTRFFTGAGIGGEYAAINSAIDELIPARVRGRVDLIINGSFWVGAALGSVAALVFLDTSLFAIDFGWRLAFGMGVVLGVVILFVRRNVPESPRWLFIHGREQEAEQIVSDIEHAIEAETGQQLSDPDESITVTQRRTIPFRRIARTAFQTIRGAPRSGSRCSSDRRSSTTPSCSTSARSLGKYFGVSSGSVPYWYVLFAVGNFLGPLTLGRLFDTVGRRPMISFCYLGAAAMLIVTAVLFAGGSLAVGSFMALVCVTFFIASAGASSAYLTVSEIFPMETRALAIAFFYAVGTAAGGITGPILFGHFINSGDVDQVALGFYIGVAVMAIGGIAELAFGVKAERRSLEQIATPLTAEDGAEGGEEAPVKAPPPPIAPRRRQPGRYRPGPGWYSASPGMPASTPSRWSRSTARSTASCTRSNRTARPGGTRSRCASAHATGGLASSAARSRWRSPRDAVRRVSRTLVDAVHRDGARPPAGVA
jgi:MFS family permease